MPARSERISILPEEDGRSAVIRSFPAWWDRGAFFEEFKARELDLGNPVDWNLAWLLSAGEAIRWDERCRARYVAEHPAADPAVEAEMRRLESALKEASWVVIESREWESGLD